MAIVFNHTAAHPSANSYVSLDWADQYFENRGSADDWSAATVDGKKQALVSATMRIDTYSFIGDKLKTWQALQFPRTNGVADSVVLSITVESATANTIVSASLKGKLSMPDEYWKDGTLAFLTSGQDNYMELYAINSFVASTGEVTAGTNFSAVPASGDTLEIIREIPELLKRAVCETALSVLDGSIGSSSGTTGIKSQKLGDESITYFDPSSSGDAGSSSFSAIPYLAEDIMSPYVQSSVKVGSLQSKSLFR